MAVLITFETRLFRSMQRFEVWDECPWPLSPHRAWRPLAFNNASASISTFFVFDEMRMQQFLRHHDGTGRRQTKRYVCCGLLALITRSSERPDFPPAKRFRRRHYGFSHSQTVTFQMLPSSFVRYGTGRDVGVFCLVEL
jgi:hypothetical protein